MCARVLGRLLGTVAKEGHVGWPTGQAHRFSVFHPAEPGEPVRRLTGFERFRCGACGGGALIDEVETFSTCLDAENLNEPGARRRRGRPPKPWQMPEDSRLSVFKLAG